MKLFLILIIFFFANLSCNNPSIVLRKTWIGAPSNNRIADFKIKFLNRLEVNSYLSEMTKTRRKKHKKVTIKKRKPYVSVYSFTFSIKNSDIIIAGIDLNSIFINSNNKTNRAYNVNSFTNDFPEKYYQTKKYLYLFRNFLYLKGKTIALNDKSSLNLSGNEKINGFIVFPRMPYSVKNAEFLIRLRYYRNPWTFEEALIRIPLKFSLFRLKP
ncbi:MAG: hypothetical protein KAS64_05640 [Spirochaetes bacterium]|nr:hypothetical protein [Spirochaetota bacterium]